MIHEDELLYFKMQLLQAEIKLHAMLEENKSLEKEGKPLYREPDFVNIIEEYGIHYNAFPFYKG